jgi:DNA repair protein SbcC/Rad50
MLTGLRLANYQSHKRTDVPLGLFTVITGPSNVGKSSMIRAGKLVYRNAPGTSYIRAGARSCAVILTGVSADGTSWVAGIERTAKGGGRYRLKIGDGEPQEFTKLGGKVPDEAAAVLRLGPLNFAGQLDGPYLLGAAGTEIAQTLGSLTNVSMLFCAAVEAGRVRKGAERDAKGAQERLDALQGQQKAFAALEGQLAAIEQAELVMAQAAQFEKDLDRLQSLILRAEDARELAEAARTRAAACAPPDLAQIEKALAKYRRLCDLMCALNQATVDVEHWGAEATMAAEREEQAHQALHDALVAAGQCPLCGQGVTA